MSPSDQIDHLIKNNSDWRGEKVSHIRKIIHQVDSEIIEEWKWDTAVFSHNGMVCAVGLFKDHVKINFFKGASIKDTHKLFNAGLEAKNSRSVDIYQTDSLDEANLKDLIKAAIDYNINN